MKYDSNYFFSKLLFFILFIYLFIYFFPFIFISWRLITYNIVVVFEGGLGWGIIHVNPWLIHVNV